MSGRRSSRNKWGRGRTTASSSSARQQQAQDEQATAPHGQGGSSYGYVPPSALDNVYRGAPSPSVSAVSTSAVLPTPPSTATNRSNSTGTGGIHQLSTLFRRAAANDNPRQSQSRRNRRSASRSRSRSRRGRFRSNNDNNDTNEEQNAPGATTVMSNHKDASLVASDDASSSYYASQQGGSSSIGGGVSSSAASPPLSSSRLFFSGAADDDSDDSYQSRISTAASAVLSAPAHHNDDDHDQNHPDRDHLSVATSAAAAAAALPPKVIVRYRGFSTSLSSLFLDEPLVCASMGCFGLLLSNRTEYLLAVRHEKKGMMLQRMSASSRQHKSLGGKNPSKIMAYFLLLTLLLMTTTFIIWGFGNGGQSTTISSSSANQQAYNSASMTMTTTLMREYQQYNEYHQDKDENHGRRRRHLENDPQQQQQHHQTKCHHYSSTRGILSLRDYHEHVWSPIFDLFQDEWNRNDNDNSNDTITTSTTSTSSSSNRLLEQQGNANDDNGNNYNNDDYGQQNNNDNSQQQQGGGRNVGADARLALGLAFLVFLGIVGRKRRMRTRYALIRARAQEDHLYHAFSTGITPTMTSRTPSSKSTAGTGTGTVGGGTAGGTPTSNALSQNVSLQNTREDQFDGACSHTLCGCYPVDPEVQVPTDEDDDEDDEQDQDELVGCHRFLRTTRRPKRKKQAKHGDCVSRGFQFFLSCCCGVICKCWFQCLSICSLAQEAREMRLLLPPRFQRIDYITHQPFIEYQKDVNDLRRGWLGKTRRKAGLMPHFYALSKLSRYILMTFTGVVVVILLTLLFNPRAAFSLPDAVVLLATFAQSFLVLYIVHWIFHKSDLSLDAVIKFFATGFLIATPTAFVFEGLIVNVILVVSYSLYSLLAWMIGEAFVNFVAIYWRIFWILGELVNAYLVAAVTEELCKYYSFRAVEHPDLIFLTGLDREANDSNAVDGGHIKYSFSSHQVSKLNRSNSFGSVSSHRSTSSQASSLSRNDYANGDGIMRVNTEEEFYEDDNDSRTYRQKAAAVTTGMIGVAVGLACAENFLYVFVLGGAQEDSSDEYSGGVMEEWIVLLFRSIFPIHALAAAMQSINMIRKFVECTGQKGSGGVDHRIGVGRIIFPAVVLHGTFDAILMAINVFIESSWDKYLEENGGNEGDGTPYNPLVVNLVAWASIICIMLMGMLWYYRENRRQRLRLKLLEERDKQKEEGGGADGNLYESPSEIELV